MNAVFDVKSARLDALSIQLYTDDLTAISTCLQERAARLGNLRNIPFTLDLQHLGNPASLDLGRLIAMFACQHLRIIGLRHVDAQWSRLAKQHRLAFSLLPEDKADQYVKTTAKALAQPVSGNTPTPRQTSTPTAAASTQQQTAPTVVVSRPVRTGQQVYVENADLIVMTLVSEGAEIIADGNIHVYGPLRGRALAGASGNKQARIFAQSMQAELVSVAGIYRVFDQHLPTHLDHHPVQVYLQDDRLVVSAIQAE